VLVFFLVYEIIWLFVVFVELLGLLDAFFFVYEVWCLCLVCRTLKWIRKYWFAKGMSGHESA
jgi:hypothetical protein